MSLLEARSIGVPILARSIPALTSLGFPGHLDRPDDLVEALVGLRNGKNFAALADEEVSQREALLSLYGVS